MLRAQARALVPRQRQRRVDAVRDLAPVHGRALDFVQDGVQVREPAARLRRDREQLVAPQLAARGLARGRVLQREVDARLDGFVEGGDAVRGQEDDALEVFEGAEEDWLSEGLVREFSGVEGWGMMGLGREWRKSALTGDEAVAVRRVVALAGARLKEDVRLVNEHDRLPRGGVALELEHVFFQPLVVLQLAEGDFQQRFLRILGGGFWNL